MTDEQEREAALRQSDRDFLESGRMKQLGFKALSAFLKKNAMDALKWAGRKQ